MSDADTLERLRLFIAIQIPEQIKVELAAAQAEVRRLLPERGVTWTKPEQFHLTLKFLGHVEAQRVADLTRQLRGACRSYAPLHMAAERVGAFPDVRFPRVVWVGLKDDSGKLEQLQAAIAATSRDYTREPSADNFSGHATLGRAKRLNRRETRVLVDWLVLKAESSFGNWTATEVELMCSELSSAGARHTCLERFPLAGLTPTRLHE